MRCKIVRAEDGYVLNIRDTDAIVGEYGLNDAEADSMESNLKAQGRWWVDADTIVMPVSA